jgi:hypothetical protein
MPPLLGSGDVVQDGTACRIVLLPDLGGGNEIREAKGRFSLRIGPEWRARGATFTSKALTGINSATSVAGLWGIVIPLIESGHG